MDNGIYELQKFSNDLLIDIISSNQLLSLISKFNGEIGKISV